MLEKAWHYIRSKFSQQQPQQKIPAVDFGLGSKQLQSFRVLPIPRTIFGHKQAEMNMIRNETDKQFKLVMTEKIVLPEEKNKKQQAFQQHADIIEEIRGLSAKFQQLQLADKRIREEDGMIIQHQQPQSVRFSDSQQSKKTIEAWRNEYRFDIEDFMAIKYSKEKSQFAPISFQQYKQIRQFWKNKTKTSSDIKTTSFDCVQKLSYRALGGLDYRQWLNDDIINIYLQMLEKRFLCNSESPFKLLNSYFATNIITKGENQIQRFLKKKNLTQNDVLIMPINNRNHWYFAIFQGKQIMVFDSMKHSEDYYNENPIFKNALKFAKFFYEREFTVKVKQDYPQQNNYYDCGVFMLLGVRDTIRSKQWSYHQSDIKYKRVQIASEILKETLIFAQ